MLWISVGWICRHLGEGSTSESIETNGYVEVTVCVGHREDTGISLEGPSWDVTDIKSNRQVGITQFDWVAVYHAHRRHGGRVRLARTATYCRTSFQS